MGSKSLQQAWAAWGSWFTFMSAFVNRGVGYSTGFLKKRTGHRIFFLFSFDSERRSKGGPSVPLQSIQHLFSSAIKKIQVILRTGIVGKY